jgi:hypothetical protein
MATIEKTLVGVHNLVGGNDYVFSLPSANTNGQPNTGILTTPVEEVYINCDITLGGINILFPAISTFNNLWNTKIYVCLTGGTVGGDTVTMFPYAGSEVPSIPSDTLNGATDIAFTGQYETYYLHIVAPNMWMALNCPPPVAPPL